MTVAIVIPVHRHAVLVNDAIASALALATPRVIVVNDGCPDAETRHALHGWSADDRVTVLTQPNLGLSAARNTGLAHALRDPDCEAVYLLDADNRLDPHAAEVWARALAAHPDADWFYPAFDFFGTEAQAHAGPAFSLALMSESNFCDAGSLIRRRVLDAGVRFDPTFRHGYEDWDFWLSAARAGFTGRPFDEAFFRYRKRPDSMLSGSHATDTALRAHLQSRHRWLYDRDTVATLLPPQFLLLDTALNATEFTDPAAPRPVSLDTALTRFLDARARPAEVFQPLTWVLARPGTLDALAAAKLLPAALWHLRQWTAQADLATLRLRRSADGLVRLAATPPGDREPPPGRRTRRQRHLDAQAQRGLRAAEREAVANADILLFSTAFLERHADRSATRPDGSTRPSTPFSRAAVARLTCALPDLPERHPDSPETAFHALDARLAQHRKSYPADQSRWRADPATVRPRDMETVLRARAHGGLPFPLAPSREPRIGFVVPIFKFGGVEKCVAALARALTARGARCHLYVYGTEGLTPMDWLTAPFDTILPLHHPQLRDWSGPRYLGTNRAPDLAPDLMRDIAAPLTAMDAVITTGCAAMGQALGVLRARGVITATWEHLLETSTYGRSYGTPYLALAHEAATDLVLTCSRKLRHWLHGQGIPASKLLTLPNGPGFPDAAPRAARPDGPLRAGFLGRLDRQKGVDRFLAIAENCRADPIAFSVTGASVVEGEAPALPERISQHPPAYSLDELHAAYARLDVLLMPSRDEGLPLSILEAQRAGVIPIVADVGAVAEAIDHGTTGLLLRSPDIVTEATDHLRRLATDAAYRETLSQPGARPDRWADNAKALLARLQPLIAARNASSRSIASDSSASDAANEMRK